MAFIGLVVGVALIVVVFIDAFEAMMLPRRVRHAYRLARIFYQYTWLVWGRISRYLPAGRWRQAFLSTFGPISLFGLLIVWAFALITGFALVHWSLGTCQQTIGDSLSGYWYFSGTTFFTLGYGDIVPTQTLGRTLSVTEAGIGFGFLAVVIGYLPVLYQAFSRREISISLLDARAGSPPSAGELFRRMEGTRCLSNFIPLLVEWERWSAELLESHLSFPVLRFYRSQHDNQSWVATLTTILDTSAVLVASVEGTEGYQSRLTFAMARHAAVDLVLVAQTPPIPLNSDRLPAPDLARLFKMLGEAGLPVSDEAKVAESLTELRGLYEPFVNALAVQLQFMLPPFVVDKPPIDNWQTSPGMGPSPGLNDLQAADARDEHAR